MSMQRLSSTWNSMEGSSLGSYAFVGSIGAENRFCLIRYSSILRVKGSRRVGQHKHALRGLIYGANLLSRETPWFGSSILKDLALSKKTRVMMERYCYSACFCATPFSITHLAPLMKTASPSSLSFVGKPTALTLNSQILSFSGYWEISP